MIYLVYSNHQPADAGELERNTQAMLSWNKVADSGLLRLVPIGYSDLPRSSLDLGDPDFLPFFNDLIDAGFRFAGADDVVALINNDILIDDGFVESVTRTTDKSGGVCVGWRRNVDDWLQLDGGVDVAAVRHGWWQTNRKRIPLMFTAVGGWDYVFRVYAELVSGISCHNYDAVKHIRHKSSMSKWVGSNSWAHNLRQMTEFFYGHNLLYPAQVAESTLNNFVSGMGI